eukprot:1693_1
MSQSNKLVKVPIQFDRAFKCRSCFKVCSTLVVILATVSLCYGLILILGRVSIVYEGIIENENGDKRGTHTNVTTTHNHTNYFNTHFTSNNTIKKAKKKYTSLRINGLEIDKFLSKNSKHCSHK